MHTSMQTGSPMVLTRRNVLKAVALTGVTALAVGSLPFAVAQQVAPPTPDSSPPVLVDGWLLSADDR